MLNIPSYIVDPDYRYKMHRLQCRLESSGNGSKTGILNLSEVSKELKRDPQYLTRFIGYELGLQTSHTNKESEGERTVIKGHHDTQLFQTVVDKFIEKYVLCPECRLPEIDILVKKDIVGGVCKACPWSGALDNSHKLATYIAKNPPAGVGFDKPSAAVGHQEKPSKSERHRSKKEKKALVEDETTASCSDDPKEKADRKSAKDKKEKKHKKDKHEKKEKKHKKDRIDEKDSADQDDGEWASDDIQATVRDITEFVVAKGDALCPDSMFEEVRCLQVTKGFNDRLRFYVMLSALFPDGSLTGEGLTSKKAFLKLFIGNAKMPFPEWIWGVQAYLAKNEGALKGFPFTTKAIFECDLASDDEILSYFNAEQDAPGFEKAKRILVSSGLLKWLESNEEESDSGSDSDGSD